MRKEIKDSEFKELVLEKKNLVVVQFHAPWCNPCKFVTPSRNSPATPPCSFDVPAMP